MKKDPAAAKRELVFALIWGGAILALALAAKIASRHGYIDNDTVLRVVIGINGLMIAWYGNRIPKVFVPSTEARRAKRVAGWSQVLSGLVYAGLWAFAPIPVAITAGSAAVVAGLVVTLGYCIVTRTKAA